MSLCGHRTRRESGAPRAARPASPSGVSLLSFPAPSGYRAWTVAGCVDTCKRMAGPGPGSLASAAAAASRLPPVGSGGGALCASHCYVYDSAFDGLVKIVRQEGAMVLWRGTAVSLLMAVPSVGALLRACSLCVLCFVMFLNGLI